LKKQEHNEKPQTYKMFKKSQNQTSKTRYRHLHIKTKVICIYLHHVFNKLKFIDNTIYK